MAAANCVCENQISDLGRACLVEMGSISRWWARCRHICNMFTMFRVKLICLADVNANGVDKQGINVNKNMEKIGG